MTLPSLRTLEKDLGEATEGSRELGDRVLLALGYQRFAFEGHAAPVYWQTPPGQHVQQWFADARPNPTTSVDAAIEAVPEGWSWNLDNDNDVDLWNRAFGADCIEIITRGSTPALALSRAIILALIEKEKGDE